MKQQSKLEYIRIDDGHHITTEVPVPVNCRWILSGVDKNGEQQWEFDSFQEAHRFATCEWPRHIPEGLNKKTIKAVPRRKHEEAT